MDRATLWRALGPVCLVVALCAGLSACTRPGAAAASRRQFIIGLRANVSSDAVADERAHRGSADVHWRMHDAFQGFVASMSDDDAKDLASDQRVAFVEPDFEVTIQAQSTPTGIARIGGPSNAALHINSASDGAVDAAVAVVDTGSDLNNPDLNIAPGVNCIGGSCQSGNNQDDNGHGTHVSGTIAAKDDGNGVVGVAPGARIVPVKVLNKSGSGSMSQIIAGLNWVASNSSRINVVNMSLGGPGTSTALNTAITNLVNRGVTVVVAAGNSNRDSAGISPANNADVITVSAVADYNGRSGGGGSPTCRNAGSDDAKATFSNYGRVVDIAAPGVCITSLKPGGGTAVMSGTSMASPHVAGAVAILASRIKPKDRSGVNAVRSALLGAGTSDWNDTSPDGVREPMLNVSNSSVFNPVMVGGSSTPPVTTPGTTPTPTPPITQPSTNATLSVRSTTGLFGLRSAVLTWSGLQGSQVTVYRGSTPITVANNGSYTDMLAWVYALGGNLTYRVCASGGGTCTSTVRFT